MKKILVILLLIFFIFSMSLFVFGCKEENEPEENNLVDIDDIVFDLSGEKGINVDNLPLDIGIFSTLSLDGCYGYCNGMKFKCEGDLTYPSGKVTKGERSFYLDEVGSCVLKIHCKIGGEEVEKNVTIKVSDVNISSAFSLEDTIILSTNEEIHKETFSQYDSGVLFKMNSKNSKITYSKAIDLRTLEGSLFEIVPNNGLETHDITSFLVRLTDAYDKSNSITLNYTMNCHGYTKAKILSYGDNYTITSSFLQVGFNGQLTAYPNYTEGDFVPYPTTTILWNQSFIPQYFTKFDRAIPLFAYYDLDENKVYASYHGYSDKDLVLDLDDPSDEYSDFKGFTTGEVYVSIEANSTGGTILLLKVGDDILTSVEEEYFEEDDSGILFSGFDFSSPISGVKGYYYPMPKVITTLDYTQEIFFNENGEYTLVSSNKIDSFLTKEEGLYKVVYTFNNKYGHEVKKMFVFEVIDEKPTISVTGVDKLNARIFDSFKVPSLDFVGGNGKLQKEYTILDGEKEVKVKEGDLYTFETKTDKKYLVVDVTDEIGVYSQSRIEIEMDYDVFRFTLKDSASSVTLFKGDEFEIPQYIAIDYSKENVSKNNVTVRILKNGIEPVDAGDVLTINNRCYFTYKAMEKGKEIRFDVYICPMMIDIESPENSVAKQFSDVQGISSTSLDSMSLKFYFANENARINMPFEVSTTDLYITFGALKTASYGVSFNFINSNGKIVNFLVEELNEKPTCYINGVYSPKTITVTDSMMQLSSGERVQYRIYSFKLDGSLKSIFNENNVLIGKIDNYTDGSKFTGFTNASTKLSIEFIGEKGGDLFAIHKVSNQVFNIDSFEFGDYGELTGPCIAFNDPLPKSQMVSLGDVVFIPYAYAYDVLSGKRSVSMGITRDGEYEILSNSAPMEYNLKINTYGKYVISFVSMDIRGNYSSVDYYVYCVDTEAPKINLNGSYQERYKEEKEITILEAEGVSMQFDDVNLVIWIEGNDSVSYPVKAGDKIKLSKGEYYIVYYALTKGGNASFSKYHIIVE